MIDAEKKLLQIKIDQKQAEVDKLAQAATLTRTKEDEAAAALAQAQLEQLKLQFDKLGLELEQQARQTAANMAQSFTDTFVQFITAAQSEGGILGALRSFGATIGKEIVEAALKEIILANIPAAILAQSGNQTIGGLLFGSIKDLFGSQPPIIDKLLKGDMGEEDLGGAALTAAAATVQAGGSELSIVSAIIGGAAVDLGISASLVGAGGTALIAAAAAISGGGIGSALGMITDLLPGDSGFAHGGYIIPRHAMRAFSSGGIVRNGPMIGMVCEEGPELVARMKPAGTSRDDDGIEQTIYIVDQRPKSLGRNDVVGIVSGDMERGGRSARAIHHVLKRQGA